MQSVTMNVAICIYIPQICIGNNKKLSVCGCGWIHADGTVGLNDITDKYPSSYEKEREIYISECYQKHKIEQVDLPYLKKCIESYGLNADEVLSEIPENRLRK